MNRKKIIIAGYPKSGNTWLTRLTAELANCPVAGFLYEKDNPEIAIEGLNRISHFECYKSHHQYKELENEEKETAKIIYIIRDPRDIVFSGQKFFYNVWIFHTKTTKNLLAITKILINKFYRWIYGNKAMKSRMIQAVLFGNKKVHYWCRIPWKAHLTPYLNNPDVLKIKYESLLSNQVNECQRILDFLGIKLSPSEIDRAIQQQSFTNVKAKFKNSGETDKVKFLRKGQSKQWENQLSKKEKMLFEKELGKELRDLDYL